ncbi:MAG: hypothetical protein BGO31_05535 [Bacteroidetes bacterium 43-16]|uniref:DNA-methyltransferase n=1 Tax=uncultured Dysgonomonas sp. TaxID=206096 RepID=UPI00092CA261|nr:site-specific DNA-methyltransferase [uncultured Dysgonomonas sp.]OJV52293.1 MAG: hypothetical protein BGO31_05535 [Bacteroidetes bacterium 43-16]
MNCKVDTNKIYTGDCLEGLQKLPDECVQCCVTSPPYWSLRDYRIEEQIGLETDPEIYVQRLIAVFNEVRRVLKPDGVLWLNIGDAYWNQEKQNMSAGYRKYGNKASQKRKIHRSRFGTKTNSRRFELKSKDLIGLPWMLAFALRQVGWYLRQDIIWHKTNPMPESVRDRCTKSHEYIFLLSKNQKYYYNHHAIKTDVKGENHHDRTARPAVKARNERWVNTIRKVRGPYLKANRRSVWPVTNKSFEGAHFAVFPPGIPELCILAGSREGDVILDPFMGAGTTALVARRHGRKYIGFELNPDYVDIAQKRLAENEP